ncbi:hypothetical protein ASZ90_011490 [hydrocarbon metagenome]|uniref:Uncharacterized protein n=1 Tax=hydrocarbon metagenome TaxID=938273 RepID=A0A0W8FEP6_9ZZZZ
MLGLYGLMDGRILAIKMVWMIRDFDNCCKITAVMTCRYFHDFLVSTSS